MAQVSLADLNAAMIAEWRDDRLKTICGGSLLREFSVLKNTIKADPIGESN
ncbi:hypothetical protein QZM35_06950 [Burkholderia sp. AU45274]|uniref:hypothetical protein n=1 Tax=Burkholderia sp. AU45274 TaxID=3059205 RepID=UPI0026531823|nr:hypothetical protein [Burkholderia sp. AU45274]MDN7487434.1 hypothetical protein [Burkholderia sp. AU45274]